MRHRNSPVSVKAGALNNEQDKAENNLWSANAAPKFTGVG